MALSLECGQCDDGDVRGRFVALDVEAEFVAVHLEHGDICDDDIGDDRTSPSSH